MTTLYSILIGGLDEVWYDDGITGFKLRAYSAWTYYYDKRKRKVVHRTINYFDLDTDWAVNYDLSIWLDVQV